MTLAITIVISASILIPMAIGLCIDSKTPTQEDLVTT